jgi:hypothetical protein
MVTESWEQAKKEASGEVRIMEKLFPNYSYFDEQKAIFTDKRVCSALKQELSRAKVLLIDVLKLSPGVDVRLTDIMERYKDDLDILIDEIDMKVYRWDEKIPQEWLQRIIEYDADLLEKTRNLQNDLQMLWDDLKKSKKGKSPNLDIEADVVKQKINSIARGFHERAEVFDIRKSAFLLAFDFLKNRIRTRI